MEFKTLLVLCNGSLLEVFQAADDGLWTMDYGRWTMDYDVWCRRWTMDDGKLTTKPHELMK